MKKVAAITGASEKDYKMLTAAAREMGSTTAFTATQAAKGLYELASAGMTAKQQVKALKAILYLAGGSTADMGASAMAVVSTLRQFSLGAEQATRVADVFSTVIDKTLFKMEDLPYAMKYAGVAAATFGWSLEQTVAAIGALRNIGLEGAQAGTQLRIALSKLAKITPEASAALKHYGLVAEDINPAMVNFGTILQRLAEAHISATDALTIFGRRGMALANVIRQMSKGTNDYQKILTALTHSAGRAANKYKQMMDSIVGYWKIAVSAVEETMITLFEAARPVIEKTLKTLKVQIDLLGKKLEENSGLIRDWTQKVFNAIQQVVAFIYQNRKLLILAGKLFIFTILAVKIVSFALAVKGAAIALKGFVMSLGMLGGPVTAAILIIGGLILAYRKLRKTQEANAKYYRDLEKQMRTVEGYSKLTEKVNLLRKAQKLLRLEQASHGYFLEDYPKQAKELDMIRGKLKDVYGVYLSTETVRFQSYISAIKTRWDCI